MEDRGRDSGRSVGAYIAAVVANAIVLWLVNTAPNWDLPFLTNGYPAVLWAVNLSILVQIVGNALLVFVHPPFLHYLGKAAFNAVSVLAMVVLVAVYPLDFSFLAAFVDTLVRIALIVGAVGTALAAVVNVFRAVGSLVRRAS